jgi:hypothetical protein
MRFLIRLIITIALLHLLVNCQAQNGSRDYIYQFGHVPEIVVSYLYYAGYLYIPSKKDIKEVRQRFIHYIDSLQNISSADQSVLGRKSNEYCRQYFGYFNENGDRILWINACCQASDLCSEMGDRWVFVFDGGSCFYQIKYNQTRKFFFDFHVNGNS